MRKLLDNFPSVAVVNLFYFKIDHFLFNFFRGKVILTLKFVYNGQVVLPFDVGQQKEGNSRYATDKEGGLNQ